MFLENLEKECGNVYICTMHAQRSQRPLAVWHNENMPQTRNERRERTEFSSEFFLRPFLAFTLRSAAKTKPEGKSGPRRDRRFPHRKPPPCFYKYLNETVVFSNRRLITICSRLLNVTSLFQWLLPWYLSWFSLIHDNISEITVKNIIWYRTGTYIW